MVLYPSFCLIFSVSFGRHVLVSPVNSFSSLVVRKNRVSVRIGEYCVMDVVCCGMEGWCPLTPF